MPKTTLLPGVEHKGRGFRARLSFNGRVHQATFATAEEANATILEWRRMRGAGITPEQATRDLTVAEAAETLLARKRTEVSRKTKQRLRPSGIAWWERATRPWREGDLAALPLHLLSRNMVDDYIVARAAEYPKTARDELDGIKASVRLAAARGAMVDSGILALDRPAVTKRRRKVLTAGELEILAYSAPDYGVNLLLFAGTVGARVGELFTLEDDRVDLAGATIFVPAHLCKEGRDKTIDLTPEEVDLLRLQLMLRAPGTALVFPTKTGRPWRHFQFLRLVWYKARERAAKAWEERGLAGNPFDGLQPHDLRATAATLMRDAGIPREVAAARLGHSDNGALIEAVYDQGDRRARVRAALQHSAPRGLLAASRPEETEEEAEAQ